MIKKITLSLAASSTLMMGATNAELEAMLIKMQKDFGAYKITQEKKIASLEKKLSSKSTRPKKASKTNKKEEVKVANNNTNFIDSSFIDTSSNKTTTTDTFESFSDLGVAASKVYHSETALSIGGYGEYKYKKYTNFKNFPGKANNETRRKSETNIVRFVPYIGYKFNDWIIMNTEIEFEDGGARSDNTKNYKYAIVEFSYLDFLFDEKYNLRVGHVLVPFGNINLNHEPIAFLTSERPIVESFIIPSTWHTNGALMFGSYDDFDYYAGIITSPDAGGFIEGRFIQQGRQGARQFTDDFSAVGRVNYTAIAGMEIGGSMLYGQTTVLAQSKPGSKVNNTDADMSLFITEAHITYKANGWDVQALASLGSLGDGYKNLHTSSKVIPGLVNGQYITVGYDVLHNVASTQKLYAVGEIERLDMDTDNETSNPDNHKFNQYTLGLAYFPDPKVVIKAEYNIKDYAAGANLADEEAFVASLGFIF